METNKISYSAVVLKKSDQEKLLKTLTDWIPKDWKKYAHHMTIKLGELPEEKKQDIGKTVSLTAYEIGKSDKAAAVKVKGYWSANRIPHITIAINTNDGGKPVDSNNIPQWERLMFPIDLSGIVVEIPLK